MLPRVEGPVAALKKKKKNLTPILRELVYRTRREHSRLETELGLQFRKL
jgi:hypothetical protein